MFFNSFLKYNKQYKSFNIRNLLEVPIPVILSMIIIFTTSILCLYSSEAGKFTTFVIKQIFYVITIMLTVFVFIVSVNVKFIKQYSYHFLLFTTILLLLTIPFGNKTMGATRWIKLGFFKIQPSEFIKISIILSCAKFFSNIKTQKIYHISSYIMYLILVLIPLLLILIQPDLATFSICFFIILTIFFIIGIPKKYTAISITLLLTSLPIVWFRLLKEYQKLRIINFLFPERDPYGSGYNVIQSKIAVGSGGLFGKGFLNSTQGKLSFLPEHRTDFIFTAVGEEYGFIGSLFIIFCYFYLIFYGIKVSKKVSSVYGKIVCIGSSMLLFLHMFINIGMTIGLMPVAGIPLIMLSYGGSSLLVGIVCVALIINIDIYKNYM